MPKRTILVVDDEANLVRDVVAVLNTRGYDASGTSDAPKVKTLIMTAQFDAVLVDIHIPGYSGVQVITDIMTFAPDAHRVCVIAMSALETDFASIMQCLALGANDFISKPINFEELEARITSPRIERSQPRTIETRITTLWDALTSPPKKISNQMKGQLLEQLVFNLFLSMPIFSVITSNVITDRGQIDIRIEHNGTDTFWGHLLLVECKNRSGPADRPQFDHFFAILRDTQLCRVGFFVSAAGFTRDFRRACQTHAVPDKVVTPVDLKQLDQLIRSPNRREDMLRKWIVDAATHVVRGHRNVAGAS